MKTKYHISLLLANIAFGANYSITYSLVNSEFGVYGTYFIRAVSMFVYTLSVMFITKNYKIEWKDLKDMVLVALFIPIGRLLMLLLGINYTTPIDGSIISTLNPILMFVIMALFFHQKNSKYSIVGLVIALTGALMLILDGSSLDSIKDGGMLGNGFIFLSVLFSVLATFVTKRLYKKYSSTTVLGYSFIIAMFFVLPLYTKDFMEIDFTKITPLLWKDMAIYIVFGSMIATSLLYYGLRGVSPAVYSTYNYVQPIVATTMAVMRGQDTLSLEIIFSTLMIFVGLFFITRK
ncbi:MAG: DMT family transporter [Rikenellaceae bacterium]